MLKIIKRAFTKEFKPKKETQLSEQEIATTQQDLEYYRMEYDNKIIELLTQSNEIPILSNTPLFIRLSFILNSITDFTINPGSEEVVLDWVLINNILNAKAKSLYDYNIDLPEKFETVEQLYALRSKIFSAANGLHPYHRQKCRKCQEEFNLNYGEINFYHKYNLKVPTHCKPCIKARKETN